MTATQKELKATYNELLKDVWKDESMIKYCLNKAAYIIELEGGELIEIEKPTIETRFCFGAGLNGYCTEEDWNDANDMAHHARTNEEYFKKENLKKIDEQIESIKKETFHTWKIAPHYYTQSKGNKLSSLVLEYWGENRYPEAREATAEDKRRIVEGLKVVKAQFEKRLNTYLKRYGLKNIITWAYLRD